MQIITQRKLIETVAQRWRSNWKDLALRYGDKYVNQLADGRSRGDISDRLDALNPETATHEEVSKIIGNESWTRLDKCSECDKTPIVLVIMGDRDEGGSVSICQTCVTKAAEMVKPFIP